MSKQVLDREQVQHLNELGLDISNTSCYIWEAEGNEYLYWGKCTDTNGIPVFTLQDILDLLPKSTKYGQLQIRFCKYPNGNYGNEVVYDSMAHNGITFFCENVIDSAYDMLCLCIKEGFVKTNKED